MTTTKEGATRGYMVLSTINCVESIYDAKTREGIYASLSPEVRKMVGHYNKVEWYPTQHVSEFFRAIALLDDDEVRANERLVQAGRFIGSSATNTFLRLIMKMMTPRLFARKVGDFWARDNRVGTMTADPSRVDERLITVKLTGIAGYDYVGPTGTGFMVNALDTIGMKGVKGKISGWSLKDPGPNEVIYHLTWDA